MSRTDKETPRANQRTGGQIGNNDSADDVRDVDLTKIHYLTGPFEIEGAAPGDLLLVEIMDVQPFEDHPVRETDRPTAPVGRGEVIHAHITADARYTTVGLGGVQPES